MIKKKKEEEIEIMNNTVELKKCCKKIDKLSISFNNEDMNKVVEKINEIIESKCQ